MSKLINRQIPIKEDDWQKAEEISDASLYNIPRSKIMTMAINKGLKIVEKEVEK